MKNIIAVTLLIVASLFTIYATSGNVIASDSANKTEQTVNYSIENMTCMTCPITVRKAMGNIDGVNTVTVDFEAKTAEVKFDSSKTNIKEIGLASTNAGYKATVIQ